MNECSRYDVGNATACDAWGQRRNYLQPQPIIENLCLYYWNAYISKFVLLLCETGHNLIHQKSKRKSPKMYMQCQPIKR